MSPQCHVRTLPETSFPLGLRTRHASSRSAHALSKLLLLLMTVGFVRVVPTPTRSYIAVHVTQFQRSPVRTPEGIRQHRSKPPLLQHVQSGGSSAPRARDAVPEDSRMQATLHGECRRARHSLKNQLGGHVAGKSKVHRCTESRERSDG